MADDFRISIAGAQEKDALLFWQVAGAAPWAPHPPHIFKLPWGWIGNLQLDMQHSVENEWLCATAGRHGLPVAPCEILRFEDPRKC